MSREEILRDALLAAQGSENGAGEPSPLDVVTLEEFVAVDEPGAEALLGDPDGAVIPEGGDIMFYGDGGAGKTTLCIDLAFHLAAGDDWLGVRVAHPARVLLIENEGPRPLFRAKLKRKRDGRAGSPLEDRLVVLEAPWGQLSFADPGWRHALATTIREREVDVVIVGPVTRSGMNEAGTLQEVRDFMTLVGEVRELAERRVAFILVHHENKGGQVSGAWEGSGDTLFHVQAQGHGRTRLYVQKARWATAQHATTLHLTWTDGEGFQLDDKPEITDDDIAEQLRRAISDAPGASWNTYEPKLTGKAQRKREIRDRLIDRGEVVNVGGKAGMRLFLPNDPELRPERDAPGTHPASAVGETAGASTASLRPP